MGHPCKRFPPHPPAPYSPEIRKKLGLVGQLYRPDFGGEGEPGNFKCDDRFEVSAIGRTALTTGVALCVRPSSKLKLQLAIIIFQ